MTITIAEASLRFKTGREDLSLIESFGIHRFTDVDTAILRLEAIAQKERERRGSLDDFNADLIFFCVATQRKLRRVTQREIA